MSQYWTQSGGCEGLFRKVFSPIRITTGCLKNKTFYFHVYPRYSSLMTPPFRKLKCWRSFSLSRGHPIILSQCLFEKWGGVSWCVIYNNLSWSLELLVIMNPWPILEPLVCRDNNDDCDDEDSAETRGWRLWTLSMGFNHSLDHRLAFAFYLLVKENGTRRNWESNRCRMLNSFVNDYLKFWLIINYSIDSVNMKSLPLARES